MLPRLVEQFSDEFDWVMVQDSQDRQWIERELVPRRSLRRAGTFPTYYLHCARDSRGDVVDYDEVWGCPHLVPRLDEPCFHVWTARG